jgi:hypothetical protein
LLVLNSFSLNDLYHSQKPFSIAIGEKSGLDGMYGKNEERAHAGLRASEYFESAMSLSALADWASARVLA